jgi:peptidoglycan/xylan/chitin deacetylase (PgdA/CDA1 family)
VLALNEASMRSGITVLMYHRVLADAEAWDYPLEPLAMPVSWFRAQVQWLAGHARVLTVADAMELDRDRIEGGRPVVCLSFDDGYRDNYELAAPILEEAGLCGTFFITAGNVEDRTPLWYDRAIHLHETLGANATGARSLSEWLESLKRLGPGERDERLRGLSSSAGTVSADLDCQLMTLSQAAELAQRGHEIGSHTLTHPILPRLDDEQLVREIQGSRAKLEAAVGRNIAGFCYPNGDHDDRVVEATREAGYAYACSTESGRNGPAQDRFRLRRVAITRSRVGRANGGPDTVGFRSEICLLRERYRSLLAR